MFWEGSPTNEVSMDTVDTDRVSMRKISSSVARDIIPSKFRYIYLLPNSRKHKKEMIKFLEDKYGILSYPKKDERKG